MAALGGWGHPLPALSPLWGHTGEVIAIVFGTVLGCLGLFLTVHFVNKRLR